MHVAVSGPASIGLAAQHGTGMIAVQPDAELVRAFDDATGGERPKIGQAVVCVGDDEAACGPDPDVHAAAIRQWVDAGFTHVAIAQVGPDQQAFLRMWETELAPRLV